MDRVELATYIFLGIPAIFAAIGFLYLLRILFDFFRLLWMGWMNVEIILAMEV